MTNDEYMARSKETLAVIHAMEAALTAGSDNMAAYFHEDFRWLGNRGCGTKENLKAFRNHWQLPLRAAFSDRVYKTRKFLADGNWASCFGYIDAIHNGEFMGIPATGKHVKIHYTDFWKVKDGRIADNWVTVDFPDILAQLGIDIFNGEGWEAFDHGEKTPPKPEQSK